MECDKPELAVFLQDCPVYKDICIDGEVTFQHTCPVENCELDHHNISYILDYELDEHSMEETERVLFITKKAESFPGQDNCVMSVIKQCNSDKKLLMKDKADFGPRDELVDADSLKKNASEGSRDKQSQDHHSDGISVDSAALKSSLDNAKTAVGCCPPESKISKEEIQENADSVPASKSESKVQDRLVENHRASLLSSHIPISVSDQNESGFSMPTLPSDHVAFSGPLQRPDSISCRSTSSTTSARSFAFPILSAEWTGSPVRMAGGDRGRLKGHRRWKSCFCCCKF